MNPVYIPATELEQWGALTAQPEKHWKPGYSAMAIAEAWHHVDGFPAPVASIFRSAGEPFSSFAPLLVIPEHKVPLPGGTRDSQNDVWVLARHKTGLASITVEGKVSESFEIRSKIGEKARQMVSESGSSFLCGPSVCPASFQAVFVIRFSTALRVRSSRRSVFAQTQPL